MFERHLLAKDLIESGSPLGILVLRQGVVQNDLFAAGQWVYQVKRCLHKMERGNQRRHVRLQNADDLYMVIRFEEKQVHPARAVLYRFSFRVFDIFYVIHTFQPPFPEYINTATPFC
jgi:hypothetical protein